MGKDKISLVKRRACCGRAKKKTFTTEDTKVHKGTPQRENNKGIGETRIGEASRVF